MHPLHEYVAKLLSDKVKSRRVVIWYDERAEFAPFIAELRGGLRIDDTANPVQLMGDTINLAEYAGSMLELRVAVEPYVSSDMPEPVVVYLPGCARDARGSVLMELEKAGTTWEPQLRQFARNLLLKRHTLGTVDSMLSADRKLRYEDLAGLVAEEGPGAPSVLKSIFAQSRGDDSVLADWLADDSRDAEIIDKAATPELIALVRSWLGLDLADQAEPAKLRSITLRYVLAGEFRSDLVCPAPPSLDGVPKPSTPDTERAVRKLARLLRSSHPSAYPSLADKVEDELGLTTATLPAGALGAIDTFRFEERELLRHCGELVADSRFDEALALVSQREHSYWLDVDVARKAQWEATRRMAELGQVAAQVRAQVSATNGDVASWFDRYTTDEGWYRLDQTQRRLEAWMTKLDDPQERPLGVVRRAYEDACHLMAEGFTRALAASGWTISVALQQTQVFSEVVSAQPRPVAYFLVDAMRYEMGLELAKRLPDTSEVAVRPAVGALPSITPVGMAALQPGAAAGFSVVDKDGKLGGRIDDVFLPDRNSRARFAKARIPNLADLALNELLSLSSSKLKQKVEGAQVVVVRSQEIDHAGEAGFTFHARQIMDTVIDNLARAIRRLANAGVQQAVVTADHGHLFFASDRDESMRIDSPGGQTIDLHRRCWIGRGGATPPGTVRVAASTLGYTSDLDLVFPVGAGVFRAGGDLAFHHGGPSLQELVIPVVTIRTAVAPVAPSVADKIVVGGVPEVITNRIFTVTFALGGAQPQLFATPVEVRPMLVADGQQVGTVGMVVDARFDSASERVYLEPGRVATVAFRLIDDTVTALRIVVQDPVTDAELYRSSPDIPVRLGVP